MLPVLSSTLHTSRVLLDDGNLLCFHSKLLVLGQLFLALLFPVGIDCILGHCYSTRNYVDRDERTGETEEVTGVETLLSAELRIDFGCNVIARRRDKRKTLHTRNGTDL